jgi:hypothetical protein
VLPSVSRACCHHHQLTKLFLPSTSGPEVKAHGRAAAVGGVGPVGQAPDRVADHAVGGQPREVALRAVQAQVLHGLASERGVAEPKGKMPSNCASSFLFTSERYPPHSRHEKGQKIAHSHFASSPILLLHC